MLLDSKLAFSLDQMPTSEGSHDSENGLDTNIVSPNLGKGAEVGVMIAVKISFDKLTSLQVHVYHGASSANALLCSSPVFVKATLVSGFNYFLPLPREVSRYLILKYAVLGTTEDTGTIDAYLTVKQ